MFVLRRSEVENESHAVGKRQLAQRLPDEALFSRLHLHRDGELSTRDSLSEQRPRPPLQQRREERETVRSGRGNDRHLVGTRGVVDCVGGEKSTYREAVRGREPRVCR